MAAGPEDILTIQIARFLKIAAPDLLWWHCPNGGYRNPREAKKLKDMGVRPGVPDLCFVLPGGLSGFIELKAGKNALEPSQKAFGETVVAMGAAYAVCRSLEAVEDTLRAWGVQMRGRGQ